MAEKAKQIRKSYAKRGACNSKMMSFRCDGDDLGFLAKVANKGKLINDLLRAYFTGAQSEPGDYPPEERDLDYYQP